MPYTARLANYCEKKDAKSIICLMREYAAIEKCDRNELEALPAILAELDRGFTVLGFQEHQEDLPVGLINCFYGFSTFELRPVVNIHDVIVTKKHRGQGVAGTMLECVQAESFASGACRMTLEVLADNPSAVRAYQKYGFGQDPAHEGIDTFFLRKTL